MADSYPLAWPAGWPRTKAPEKSQFKTPQERAQRLLLAEVEKLGGRNTVVSTNVELNLKGFPYANQRVADTGVAVYFMLKQRQMVFACDRFQSLAENIHAIGKTIEALRGIDRWGASQMMERAFSGFTALPPSMEMPPVKRSWWEVLGVSEHATQDEIKAARNALALKYHPDTATGYVRDKNARIAEVNAAFDEATT